MGDEAVGSSPSPSPSSNAAAKVQGGRKGLTPKECEEIIQKTLSSNPKVKILMEKLEKSGCEIGTNFIRAVHCEDTQWQGEFRIGKGVENTMIHELIHAYDAHVKVDSWDTSAHMACSEIRAYRLSGDCLFKPRLLCRHIVCNDDPMKKIENLERECVKKKSIESLLYNYSPAEAESAVEAVWSRCYNDTEPFHKAP